MTLSAGGNPNGSLSIYVKTNVFCDCMRTAYNQFHIQYMYPYADSLLLDNN